MKLEVGKKYKTRSGMSAFVFSVSGREQEAIGYIELLNNEGHVSAEWFSDGTFFKDKREAGSDIVAEWHDKPDPGEGWRLLHPNEEVEEGDEYYSPANNTWLKSGSSTICGGKQGKFAYRRRIAPQYVPYTWDDREELRGRWFRRKAKGPSQYERLACFFCLIDGHFYVNSIRNDELLNECEWLDGSPCGKKVV